MQTVKRIGLSLVCAVALSCAWGTEAQAARVLKLASTMATTQHTVAVLQDMAAQVQEKTGGSLEIQVFPASQLGGIRDFVEGLSLGTIEMAVSPVASLESFGEPRFALFALPYVFEDDDHITRFYKSAAAQEIFEDFRRKTGIRSLGMFNEGFRDIWSKKAVRSFEDLKGLKLRVPEIPLYVDMFTAMGVNSTPMPVGDVYTSLQTGTIQGLENCFQVVLNYQYFEVVDYRIATQHCGNPMVLIISDAVWGQLTVREKQVLQECIAAAEARDASELAAMPAQYQEEFARMGLETIVLPDAEMDKIKAAVKPVQQNYLSKVASRELVQAIEQLRAK